MLMKAVARVVAVAGTTMVLGAFIFVIAVSRPTQASVVGASPLPGQDPPAASIRAAALLATIRASCGATGLTSYVSFDGPARTIANETFAAAAVVEGTVTTIETPIWNTKDGMHDALGTAWPHGLRIYTPVVVSVTSIVKGFLAKDVTILLPGGIIECDRQFVENGQAPVVGESLAMFLSPSITTEGNLDPSHPAATATWIVDGTGSVATPADGAVSLADFTSIVRKAIAP